MVNSMKQILCKKEMGSKIYKIIRVIIYVVLDIFLISEINGSMIGLVIVIIFSIFILIQIIDILYWLFQPKILVYQYETGIIIGKKHKIEYIDIKKVYYKKSIFLVRKGYRKYDTEHDDYVGTIYIETKDNKKYKIKNVFYPIKAFDILSKIKKQKKYR